MPDDPILLPQQTRRPPMGEEIRRERIGLENENRELTTTKSLDKLAPPTQINPMFLDSKHDAEVSNLLSRGIPAFTEGKGITKATNFEKIEALVWIMRDSDYFNFRYNPASQGNPKTVEETYSTREGDCDELSRVFVVLANKMGITDFTQLYVNFKEKNTS
ncbi:TPA: transglutaminase family protein [Candidatus Micrarchaeota archaeon]|nr:transglutaminase family protein [Candidatus Micrarchaeota archaeon]